MALLSELFDRQYVIFAHAWRTHRENSPPRRAAYELAFLPAHLELTETPPHPAPLWTARVLLVAALLVVLTCAFGQLDIVAVAPGQLIPNANVKVIQPAVTGVVRRILVRNGERVSEGQLLIDLDPTQAAADADKAKTSKIDAQLTLARAQALLTALEKNSQPQVVQVTGATPERQADTQNLAQDSIEEYRQRIESLKAELQRRVAEPTTASR